jgi:acyl-CoA thioester hydrolase
MLDLWRKLLYNHSILTPPQPASVNLHEERTAMPLTLTRTFRIRFYECDYYGHVNQSTYLRYMAETAFDASAAAGFDMARYAAMNRYWLVHDTEVEYLNPLRYGDEVEVTTWVMDFRHVRSRRAYELRRAGSGEMVARGSSDWVFMNTATGRPAPIPAEMMAAFFPEGVPPAPTRTPFPAAPQPPPGVFQERRQVEWRDLDSAQHVNNAVYLSYLEECAIHVAAAHGWPLERMTAERLAVVARRHRIEYLLPARLGDELEISTWASDVRRTSAVRHFHIRRLSDGELLARAHTFWAWLNLDTGQPRRMPPTFLADFKPNIAPAAAETG